MFTKKRMKTKFDYQARTFGACVVLLMSFTLMFISPSLEKVSQENTAMLESIEKIEEKGQGVEESFNIGLSDTEK